MEGALWWKPALRGRVSDLVFPEQPHSSSRKDSAEQCDCRDTSQTALEVWVVPPGSRGFYTIVSFSYVPFGLHPTMPAVPDLKSLGAIPPEKKPLDSCQNPRGTGFSLHKTQERARACHPSFHTSKQALSSYLWGM